MSTQPPSSEEELRAAYEAELKRLKIEHLLLEHVVTLINLGMRRTGLAAGTEDERDPDQVRLAIDAARALLPLIEPSAPDEGRQIRDAISQLQLAYVRIGGSPTAGETPSGPATGQTPPAPGAQPPPAGDENQARPSPGEPGPAQRSGRLWIPGQ